jgi:hypothetical protein
MVTISYDLLFKKKVKGVKDGLLKTNIKKKIHKIVNSPTIGKPM